MPNINDLKKSKFLTKIDVEPAILCTIRGYDSVNVAQEGAPPDEKWALHFNELDKPLVLNSTNGQIIAAFTGSEDFDGWIGKQVVLYFDPNVSFGGKLTGGIRCRAPKKKAAPPTTSATASAAPKPEPSDNDGGNVDDVIP
jgi:hypothetical protein